MTQATDTRLIERLRAGEVLSYGHPLRRGGYVTRFVPVNPDGPELADRIESLRAEVARLREALLLWRAYDDQDEADFAEAGPMLLYARAIDATRTALGDHQ